MWVRNRGLNNESLSARKESYHTSVSTNNDDSNMPHHMTNLNSPFKRKVSGIVERRWMYGYLVVLFVFIFLSMSILWKKMYPITISENIRHERKIRKIQMMEGTSMEVVKPSMNRTNHHVHDNDDEKNNIIQGQKTVTAIPDFVTVVMPSVVNPSKRKERLQAISDTWGPHARALFVLHSEDEFSEPLTEFPKNLIVPTSVATVEDGVQRLVYVIITIYQQYNPDFAFFVNDHTFVIPEHLCTFLLGRNPNDNLYAGHAMKNDHSNFAFNSGASGYFLSKATMSALIQKWESNDPSCSIKNAPPYLQNNPGLLTAKCLNDSLKIKPIDTRDILGRHLFHPYGIVRTVVGNVDNWFLNKHVGLGQFFENNNKKNNDSKRQNSHTPQKYEDCCSSRTVSFHYVEAKETLTLFDFRKLLHRDGSKMLTDESLEMELEKRWPQKNDLGEYSQKLPTDKKLRSFILKVLKNISTSLDDDGNVCSSLQ